MYRNKQVFSTRSSRRLYAAAIGLTPAETAALALACTSGVTLDLGIGAGRTTAILAPLARHYVGVDYAPGMVTDCRTRFAHLPRTTFLEADAAALDTLQSATFDLVLFSYNGLDYVAHPHRLRILHEIRRLLAPGGCFVFSTHNRAWRGVQRRPRLARPLRARGLARTATEWLNWTRLRPAERDTADYALVNDAAHRFALVTYCIGRAAQLRQLRRDRLPHHRRPRPPRRPGHRRLGPARTRPALHRGAPVMTATAPPAHLPPTVIALVWAATLCFLTISATVLDINGYSYSLAGGSIVLKVHPGTYLLLAAILVFLLQGNPIRIAGRAARESPAHAAFLVVVLVLIGYVLARFGATGSAFLLDLYVAPVLMAILLARFRPRQSARLLLAIIGVLALDAAIGIAEYATGVRLTPYLVDGKPVAEAYFRSTALLGHPLQNALAVVTALMIVPAMTRNRLFALAAGLLLLASLVPFGGRTAAAVAALMAALALPIWLIRTVAHRRLTYLQLTGWALGTLVLLTTAGAAFATYAGQIRILKGLGWDASSNTRIVGLRILDTVSPLELLFGIGPQEIRRRTDILGSYHGIIGLENSWLLLFLIFGGLGVLLFVAALLTWLGTILRGAPAAAWLATIAFLAVASSNNTLASKDTTLILLVIMLYGVRGYAAAITPGADTTPTFRPRCSNQHYNVDNTQSLMRED